jgi:hypothetical protein
LPGALVHGVLEEVGGPGGRRPSPVRGSIELLNFNGLRCGVSTNAQGAFTIVVVPGRYTVTGHSPDYGGGQYPCSAANPVTVNEPSTSVVVTCQIK